MGYFTNNVLSKCRRLHKVKVFTFTEWQSSHSRVSEVPGALAVPVQGESTPFLVPSFTDLSLTPLQVREGRDLMLFVKYFNRI